LLAGINSRCEPGDASQRRPDSHQVGCE